MPAFSSVKKPFLFNETIVVARRLQPVRAWADGGTDYDISDVVVPT